MKKTAIVVGVRGQDGTLLTELLAGKEYAVIGLDRGSVDVNGINWSDSVDITDKDDVVRLIKSTKPDEIYFLAAYHVSSEDAATGSYELLQTSYSINVFAYINFLESIRTFSPKSRIFYACSSMIYSESRKILKNENSPYLPNNIYGITKLDGLLIGRHYRENHALFIATGILFNHESWLRPKKFIAIKIIQGALDIAAKRQNKLVIGDLEAGGDWGYAPDYVDAMHRMLQTKKADDFIIATGHKHTVLDFVEIAFEALDLDWKKYVTINPKLLTRKRDILVGDAGKLREATGWRPSINFKDMILSILNKLK